MLEFVRPVRSGIIIGLLGIIFGIGWAFWLVLGHERIHGTLEESAAKAIKNGLVTAGAEASPHGHGANERSNGGHGHAAAAAVKHGGEAHSQTRSVHEDPVMELSHQRLVRGHLHAMGLGIASVIISVVIGFTTAPDRIKTAASAFAAAGGIVYPVAWIVMGYRTPALGPDLAEKSVVFIAGPGVALVLIGVFTALAFTVKDMFSARKPSPKRRNS